MLVCTFTALLFNYPKIPISPELFCSKGFLLGLFSGELIFGGANYWREFCVSKLVGLDDKNNDHRRDGNFFFLGGGGGGYFLEGLFFAGEGSYYWNFTVFYFSFLFSKNGKVQKRGKVNLIGRLQLSTEKAKQEENDGIVALRILRIQVRYSSVCSSQFLAFLAIGPHCLTAVQLQSANICEYRHFMASSLKLSPNKTISLGFNSHESKAGCLTHMW